MNQKQVEKTNGKAEEVVTVNTIPLNDVDKNLFENVKIDLLSNEKLIVDIEQEIITLNQKREQVKGSHETLKVFWKRLVDDLSLRYNLDEDEKYTLDEEKWVLVKGG